MNPDVKAEMERGNRKPPDTQACIGAVPRPSRRLRICFPHAFVHG